MENIISVSVGNIIEFVHKCGDIKSVFLSSSRAVDGIKTHQRVQNQFAQDYKQYEMEVPISKTLLLGDISLRISGRIDGIISDGEIPVIDEIKSTQDLVGIDETYSKLHWAQAKMYAYMYASEHDLDEITVQLTYAELGSKELKQFQNNYTIIELEGFFMNTVHCYIEFAKKIVAYNTIKEESIKELQFPFDNYRKGQRKLMTGVYQTIVRGETLFARAPTGIGKTMSTLFPAIKSLSKQPGKIFYLTAKTVGRDVAEKALNLLKEKGLVLKSITITAKDKVCLNNEKKCDGSYCSYAKGHFDRINDALSALIDASDNYNREIILEYAERYHVCPYELTLDLTLYCDCIICDYNYAFDPGASLKRYFAEGNGHFLNGDNSYIFLIDEAHNLVERARSMYSAVISKKTILGLKKKLKDMDKPLYRYLNKMNNFMIQKRYDCDDNRYVVEDNYSKDIVDLIRGVVHRTEKIFAQLSNWEHMDELLEFYFDCHDFLRKVELYDERYVTYYEKYKDEVRMKIYCLDPSCNLKSYMDNANAVVLFSATLTPMNYFITMLGGNEHSYWLSLESPFNPDNLGILIHNNVSTKFNDREKTYNEVVNAIHHTICGKKGNYIVYFPSYQYMDDIYERFAARIDQRTVMLMRQERGLIEKEKEAFLKVFYEDHDRTLVAFAVLGGIFGEGIDLQGEKLSGAIIVGVGLPSICLERDLIKTHFDKYCNDGFKYAYMYPGMNKVMQAAGRVIRTQDDVGIVVLIDERFSYRYYKSVFPPEWNHAKYLSNNQSLQDGVDSFWSQNQFKINE